MRYLFLIILLSISATSHAEEPPQYDYDAEIKRKRAELLRVKKQIAEVKKATRQDAADFASYKTRTKERAQGIIKQTAAIQKETGELRAKHARLGAIIGGHRRSVRGFEARQKNFTRRLIQQCDRLMAAANKLSPMLSGKAVAALDYLKSELLGRSADNIEGLHRLVRIARQLDAQLMDVQVSQGSSPVPGITGTVHHLRFGGVFEAVVRGESAAVWDAEAGTWRVLDDPAAAKMILAAVKVRNGEKKPALVSLPLAAGAQAESQPAPASAPPKEARP